MRQEHSRQVLDPDHMPYGRSAYLQDASDLGPALARCWASRRPIATTQRYPHIACRQLSARQKATCPIGRLRETQSKQGQRGQRRTAEPRTPLWRRAASPKAQMQPTADGIRWVGDEREGRALEAVG